VRRAALVALPVLGAGALAAVLLAGGGGEDGDARAQRSAAGVATVERRTLIDSALVAGTLGYADERPVTNRLSGTVTWLPAVGSVVRTGETLLKVDGEPVVLFDGEVPMYRSLRSGVSDGADVLQLERSLRRLRHTTSGMDVDRHWDADTTAAVERWQRARGLDDSGTIELGRVAFLPGSRRVTAREVAVGSAGSGSGSGGGGASGVAWVGTRGGVTALAAVRGLWSATLGGEVAQAATPRQAATTDTTTTGTATTPATTAPTTTTPAPTTPVPTATTPGTIAPATTTPRPTATPTPTATAAPSGRSSGGLAGAGASAAGGSDTSASSSSSSVATTVLTTTSTRRVVSVDLGVADQELAAVGRAVEIELPDGRTIRGRIARVGTVATAAESGSDAAAGGGGEDAGDPTIEVTIRLTGRDRGGRLDQAPVSVSLARETRKNALTVPVTALVARRGGGYAVERIAADGSRSLVDVEPGLFADGDVELARGVREGDRVAVPK